MAEKRVKLKSSDEEMFEVEEAVAFESQTVKYMIEDTGMDHPIPLPNVSSKILAKVIEYCKYHVDNQKSTDDKPEDEIKAWDLDFVKVDQATLFDLILAANYLNIKNLLDLTCQVSADMTRGKTLEEICKTFNIDDLFIKDKEEFEKGLEKEEKDKEEFEKGLEKEEKDKEEFEKGLGKEEKDKVEFEKGLEKEENWVFVFLAFRALGM